MEQQFLRSERVTFNPVQCCPEDRRWCFLGFFFVCRLCHYSQVAVSTVMWIGGKKDIHFSYRQETHYQTKFYHLWSLTKFGVKRLETRSVTGWCAEIACRTLPNAVFPALLRFSQCAGLIIRPTVVGWAKLPAYVRLNSRQRKMGFVISTARILSQQG